MQMRDSIQFSFLCTFTYVGRKLVLIPLYVIKAKGYSWKDRHIIIIIQCEKHGDSLHRTLWEC